MKVRITDNQMSVINEWLKSESFGGDFDYINESIHDYLMGESSIIDELHTLSLDEVDPNFELKKSFKVKNKSAMSVIADVLDKYDGENVYISFRKDLSQTLINPKNKYSTPTGLYCYPLVPVLSKAKISWKNVRNMDPEVFFASTVFPFASQSEFFYLFHISNDDRVFYSGYEKDTLSVVKEILADFPEAVEESESIANYLKTGDLNIGFGRTHVRGTVALWNFIFVLHDAISLIATYREYSSKSNYFFTSICNKYNIHGFVDDVGEGFIHMSEPIQAVFFHKLKSITDYYTTVSKTRGRVFKSSNERTYSQVDFRKDEFERSTKIVDNIEKYLTKTFNLPYVVLIGGRRVHQVVMGGLYFFGTSTDGMFAFKMDPESRKFSMEKDINSIKDQIDMSLYDEQYQMLVLMTYLRVVGYGGVKTDTSSVGREEGEINAYVKAIPNVEDSDLYGYYYLGYDQLNDTSSYPMFLNMLGEPYRGVYNHRTADRLHDSAGGKKLLSAYINGLLGEKFIYSEFVSNNHLRAYRHGYNDFVDFKISDGELVRI